MPSIAFVLMASWASVLGLLLAGIRLPLVVSYLGRQAGKALTTTTGHPGLAGLIHVGDTPSWYPQH